MEPVQEGRPEIVVGVDGSKSSAEALRWAVRQAEFTGSTLRVITAWSFPNHPTPFGIVPALPLPESILEGVVTALEEWINEEVGPQTEVHIIPSVIERAPAAALVEAARDADLLVVGNRGHGAFTGMLLGSVSMHCAVHSPRPVVIVHS